MVVTNDGKNWIKDQLETGLDVGEYGLDDTSPSVGDGDLISGVSATNASLVKTTGNKTVNATLTLLSTVEAGTTFNEAGIFMSDGTMFDRVVFPDYDHTSSDELQTTFVLRVE